MDSNNYYDLITTDGRSGKYQQHIAIILDAINAGVNIHSNFSTGKTNFIENNKHYNYNINTDYGAVAAGSDTNFGSIITTGDNIDDFLSRSDDYFHGTEDYATSLFSDSSSNNNYYFHDVHHSGIDGSDGFGFMPKIPNPITIESNLAIWAIIDGILLMFILSGNILTILAVRFSRRLRSVTSNMFVLSLAISDMVVGFTLPYHLAFYMGSKLGESRGWCLLRFFLIILACCVSIWNLIAIAVDRYIAIVYPLHYTRYMTKKVALFLLGFGWVLGVTFALIPMFWNNWETAKHCEFNEILPPWYMAGIITPGFSMVWICMLIVYWRIWKEASKHAKQMRSSFSGIHRGAPSDWKSIQVVLFILGCFSICWLPYFIIACAQMFKFFEKSSPTLYKGAFSLAMANSGINPIIYSWKNSSFRNAFIQLLRCKNPDHNEHIIAKFNTQLKNNNKRPHSPSEQSRNERIRNELNSSSKEIPTSTTSIPVPRQDSLCTLEAGINSSSYFGGSGGSNGNIGGFHNIFSSNRLDEDRINSSDDENTSSSRITNGSTSRRVSLALVHTTPPERRHQRAIVIDLEKSTTFSQNNNSNNNLPSAVITNEKQSIMSPNLSTDLHLNSSQPPLGRFTEVNQIKPLYEEKFQRKSMLTSHLPEVNDNLSEEGQPQKQLLVLLNNPIKDSPSFKTVIQNEQGSNLEISGISEIKGDNQNVEIFDKNGNTTGTVNSKGNSFSTWLRRSSNSSIEKKKRKQKKFKVINNDEDDDVEIHKIKLQQKKKNSHSQQDKINCLVAVLNFKNSTLVKQKNSKLAQKNKRKAKFKEVPDKQGVLRPGGGHFQEKLTIMETSSIVNGNHRHHLHIIDALSDFKTNEQMI